MAKVEPANTTGEAALARKHRIAMRKQRAVSSCSLSDEDSLCERARSKRQRVALDAEVEPMVISSATDSASVKKTTPNDILESIKKKKPHITGIKKQSRYDPGVEMTKEELKAWRKEARRVRNRESAAASRKKNREAIEQLESQVKGMQSKYDTALGYIIHLQEQLRQIGMSPLSCPSSVLLQDLEDLNKDSSECLPRQTVSPPQSPTPIEQSSVEVDPLHLTPQAEHRQQDRQRHLVLRNDPDKNFLSQPSSRHSPSHPAIPNSQKHIIDNMIIRPIACV